MATSTIVRNNKRILYAKQTSSFSVVTSNWTSTGLTLTLPKGNWLLLGEYRITGANTDAGINLGYSNKSAETFHYRGANTNWNHPITLSVIDEITSDTTLRCHYYTSMAGTISYVSLIAIEI